MNVEETHKTEEGAPGPRLFAEFFAGIGLMRVGLEKAGWKIAFANDIDTEKESMYKRHFKDEENHFLLGDIHDLSEAMVPTVSLATASFPCTDLSLAGRREGLEGKQSSAFWGFIKILKDMGERRPSLIVLENVTGFLTSKEGEDFYNAMQALNELGYAVDPFIIDAARFVPQSRVRLFIVGKRTSNIYTAQEKQMSFFQSQIRPEKLAMFIADHPDINWDLWNFPDLPERNMTLADIIQPLRHTASMWWDESRVEYLLRQMFDRHKVQIENAKDKRKTTYFTAFRRKRDDQSMAEIRSDGIAGCLRTPKGGSAKQILLKVGNGNVMVRLLTGRECARLMGADDYKLSKNVNRDLFGFGDAVCAPVVTWIAENYLNPLIEQMKMAERELNQFSHAC